MTKLVLAIINNDDSAIAASALNAEGFFVTKLSTTGGFLMVGNTTLLIGTETAGSSGSRRFSPAPAPRASSSTPPRRTSGRG